MKSKTAQRIFDRFEIAVTNFGNSCIQLQSNERTFQGWFMSMVIQEFGISHVYRDVDIVVNKLFTRKEIDAFHYFGNFIENKQVIPDVIVSWNPDVDTRNETLRPSLNHSDFLNQFAILSELKVTGSTTKPTSTTSIRNDIVKLGLLGLARRKENFKGALSRKRNLGREYMVIIDNFRNSKNELEPKYTIDYFEKYIIQNLKDDWKKGIPIPDVFLISPKGKFVEINVYRNFIREKNTKDESPQKADSLLWALLNDGTA